MDNPFLFQDNSATNAQFNPFAERNDSVLQEIANREDPYKRHIIDRVLAPFNAPQQFLFAATKVAAGREGVLPAFGTAIRHASPFSNAEPVDANEIREIFGGNPNAKGAARWGPNLAISLLYDPLNVVPLGKAVGLLDEAASFFGPAKRAAGAVARPINRAAGQALDETLGPVRHATLRAQAGRMFVSKYAGMPQEMQRAAQGLEQKIHGWRTKAYGVIKRAESLGGVEGQRLMADALEDGAFFNARLGDEAALPGLKRYQERMAKLGIDEEKFLDVYDKARFLDDEIGEELFKVGVLSRPELKEMQGAHLRRMIRAYEKPTDYVDRIQALGARRPDLKTDTERFSVGLFRKELNAIRTDLDNAVFKVPEKYTVGAEKAVHPEGTQFLFHPSEAMGITRVETAAADAANIGNLPRVKAGYKTVMDTNIGRTINARGSDTEYLKAQRSRIAAQLGDNATRKTPQPFWDLARLEAHQGNIGEAQRLAQQGLDLARQEAYEPQVIRSFNELLSDLGGTPQKLDRTVETNRIVNRYFKEGDAVRFNVRNFTDDLDAHLRTNSNASATDIFEHIQRNMLNDVEMPESFWKSIGGFMTKKNGEDVFRPGAIGKSFKTIRGTDHFVKKLNDLANNGSHQWRSFKENLDVVARREQIPDEILAEMGPVREFGPRLAAQTSDAGRLLEMRKFFDDIAGVTRNPDDPSKILSKDGSRIASPTAEGIRGPSVQLKGEHLGALDGMYVQPSVAVFLQHMEGNGAPSQPTAKMWQKLGDWVSGGVGQFKLFKTVVDPGAQVRNFIGGLIQMDIGGTHPYRVDRLVKAANELIQTGKSGTPSKYLKLAEDAGVSMFQNTFSRQELRQYADALSAARWSDKKGIYGALENVFAGMGKAANKPMNAAIEAFEFQEKMLKLTVFIDKYEGGLSKALKAGGKITPELQTAVAKQAGEMADQALFNYADVPVMVDFARKYGVAPFVTFPFKAIPYTAKTLVDNPHRVLKYHRGVEGYNEALAGSPEDVEREIAALPAHVRERLVAKMPFDDADGRPQYADLSFFLPWYVIQDTIKSIPGMQKREGPSDLSVMPREGLLNSPVTVLIDAFRRNEDGLGRPIMTPDMTTAEKWGAFGKYLYQFVAPPGAVGGTRSESIGRQMQAIATTSPEQQNWATRLTAEMGLTFDPDAPGANKYGLRPQTQAQVGGSQVAQAIGLDPAAPPAQLMGGLEGLFAMNTVAADPTQTVLNEGARARAMTTDLAKQIARIRTNPNMTLQDKMERIQRLKQQQIEVIQEQSQRVAPLF